MIEHGVAKQVDAFRLMWDAFPEPAMLIGDGWRVLAANALGRRLGITAGGRCGGLAPVEAPPTHNPMERLRNARSALVELAEANGQAVLPLLGAGRGGPKHGDALRHRCGPRPRTLPECSKDLQ